MTDRPSWMPSRESLLSLAHNETLHHDCGDKYAGEELEEVIREAALRAKIEELESLVLDGLVAGYSNYRLVDRARARIAELREELAK